MSLPRSYAGTGVATKNERAIELCARSKAREEAGDYEGAARVLGEFWAGVGVRPRVEGLDPLARAEVLLRAGVLTGWLGATQQIEGSQEAARDLISEAQRAFEGAREVERGAVAQTELGFCYWRSGELEGARAQFRDALAKLSRRETVARIVTALRIAAVELRATRYADALRILLDVAHVAETRGDDDLKGRFHNTLGMVRGNLATTADSEAARDAEILEYTAALFHFEQASNVRFQGYALNNLGMAYFAVRQYEQAHTHLRRARRFFVSLNDFSAVAQVDDTRARVFLAQNKPVEAERTARDAVRVLERGELYGLLADAITTHAAALAALGKTEQALEEFHRAHRVALDAGERAAAGRTSLTMIEALNGHMTPEEMRAAYLHAEELLSDVQHPETVTRLRACARRVLAAQGAGGVVAGAIVKPDEPISLRDEMLRFEGELIRRAWELTGGRLRRAAYLLGVKHQALSLALRERHKGLLGDDEKPTPPKRSLTNGDGAKKGAAKRREPAHAGAAGRK